MEEKSESKIKLKFNILAIFCIIIFCFAISPVSLQNDTFYTIKIGEHILENGIDYIDPFSWHEDLPYTYPHWLYDVGIYLIYNLGGYLGIYISTIVLACILGIVVYLTNVKLTKNNLVAFIITIGVIYLLKNYIAARAQLVTFILFTLTIYFIEMFLETKKKRYAISLIIIPIIVANVHLAVWPFYFILYLPYIAEYIICLIADSHFVIKIQKRFKNRKLKKLVQKQDETKNDKVLKLQQDIEQLNLKYAKVEENQTKRRENPYKIKIQKSTATKWLILIMLICVLTGLLTPLKDAPYTYLYKTMQGNTTKSISEHLPLTLINQKEFMCLIVIYLAILICTDVKIRLRDLFMLGGLLLLAFMTRRQMSMYILLGSYILARLIEQFLNKYDPKGSINMMKCINTWIGKILTLVIILVLSFYFYKPKMKQNFISSSSYPVEAVKYIKENLDVNNIKLYNEYNYGSYLLLNDIPVFIDSRADLYAPEFNGDRDIFSDFINISNVNVYYEEILKKYEITHLITYKNSKLNIFLSRDENYKQLYLDDHFVIYERQVSES